MLTKEHARSEAEKYVRTIEAKTSRRLALLDAATREEDFGWVFFYNTKEYVETGAREWALAGNAPIIIDRRTGKIHVTGTAFPIEHYINVYRRDGHLERAHE